MSRRILAALAGPLLITAAVIVVLHDIALLGRISIQHVDPLPYWLPSHCFLGESLAAGSVPGWNPHVMGGVPFAADPQSGWLYAPAMLLYRILPCAAALNAFVVLQPILAALGLYAFLRAERLSRAAATVAGLSLGLAIASSRVVLTLPFSGAVAWTAVMLACAARLFRAERPSARVLWAVAAAAAWGQVASAHLSHGLVVGTAALAAYAIARTIAARSRDLRWLALLAASLPLVNIALLLPRLAYLTRSTFSFGYDRMDAIAADLAGRSLAEPGLGAAVSPPWVLGFAASPGAYMGITALLLAFLGWRVRSQRPLVAAFGLYAGVCYLLSLHLVARGVEAGLSWLPFAEFYLHEPSRMRYGVLLALPVLAGLGVEAWRQEGRLRLLIPGVGFWLLLPAILGLHPTRLALPLIAAGAALLVLAAVRSRPALIGLVPGLLALEVVTSGLAGQKLPDEFVRTGLEPPLINVPFTPLVQPPLSTGDYLRPGPLVEHLRREGVVRFISLDRSRISERGYLEEQRPQDWGLLANQRSMLFGLEDAQGYNPIQQIHYWRFLRAVEPKDIKYNAAVFIRPPPVALDLLQIGWIVGPGAHAPLRGAELEVSEEGWGLYALPDPAPRASFIGAWRVIADPQDALDAVLTEGFDPRTEAVVEEDPGITQGGSGSARFRWQDPHEAVVEVEADGPGLVLVRNAHDPHWKADLDGDATRVLRADALVQAVPVPAGRHTLTLRYRDPWIGGGALGSALALGGLLLLAAGLRRRERRSPATARVQRGTDSDSHAGHDPGEPRRERTPHDRQHHERGQDVHRDGHDRDHAEPRGEPVDPEPSSGEQAGQEQ